MDQPTEQLRAGKRKRVGALTAKRKEEIGAHIKDAIIRGRWKSGERVVEARLCRELGESRSRVRDALRQVAQDGFIDLIPNTGALVKDLSQREIAQIYDLMGALEGLAARVATPTMPDELIDELDALTSEMEDNRLDKFLLWQRNFKFHQLISSSSKNHLLINFMANIRSQTHRMSLQSFYPEEQVRATLREHRAIVNAIRDRKPLRVENIIRKHYQDAKNRLIRFMNSSL
jgi:DNA-binding GntR family transcriptional regulator